MNTQKPKVGTPEFERYILNKQKELLKFIKEDVKNGEDEFGSKELFNTEVARYFKVEHKNNNRSIKQDSGMILVKTKMFGGQCKHIIPKYYGAATKWLNS